MMFRTLAILLGLAVAAPAAHYISVKGSVVVARVMQSAAPELGQQHDIEFRAVTEGGSADAIAHVAHDLLDLALSVRMLAPEEQASRPDKKFVQTVIGKQALVVVVSEEIWNAGVKALTKDQLRAIYERDIKNWKAVGGPDREITYYNRESTYGVWDCYMQFLYGDVRKAMISKAETIDNPEEAKTAVQFGRSAYSVVEFGAYEEGKGLRALGIKQPDGTVIEPTLANLASDRYEIARPLVLITGRQPTGKLREMVEFMLSPKGQAHVRKTWNVPITDLEAAKTKK
jgi:phosphate transport system substrate-binding protein